MEYYNNSETAGGVWRKEEQIFLLKDSADNINNLIYEAKVSFEILSRTRVLLDIKISKEYDYMQKQK